ncbi:MAG: acetyl-CoA carboxylase biotin carboxylase subunit [Pseudomonadota bacterium]|nr:acetyl-CoA carboxylase biotin carboxylase subunit [Pseudomonadota bacterium]
MFSKVLIANRGEIAVRILRACKELGIQTVAVYSSADKDSMHVKLADESVCIGPPSSLNSYLNIPAIISACEISGAEAVHPGYGFLSENYGFAEKLEAHDIKFIGPRSEHIKMMGDKILAKESAKNLGLPIIPGSSGEIKNTKEGLKIAEEIGYPIIIKASSGGGGRGMVKVFNKDELDISLKKASSEAEKSFNDKRVYIEKYLENPKHIEIQVMGDEYNNIIHLGERDCSIQRRNQKLIKETPASTINEEIREEIYNLTINSLKSIGYSNAGTIEYLYEDGNFYFMEMNTRLQVEHPISEEIFNFDLVKEQILVAAKYKLSTNQENLRSFGHSIECRINAEDPNTFIPCPGKITNFYAPSGPGVRIDSNCYSGLEISPYYDSLIAKLIIHDKNREACIKRLKRALSEFVIDGIKTTIPFFQEIIDQEKFLNGDYNINWLEEYKSKKV